MDEREITSRLFHLQIKVASRRGQGLTHDEAHKASMELQKLRIDVHRSYEKEVSDVFSKGT